MAKLVNCYTGEKNQFENIGPITNSLHHCVYGIVHADLRSIHFYTDPLESWNIKALGILQYKIKESFEPN